LASARWLRNRDAFNDIWARQLTLRRKLAANSGLPDYRAYRWRQLYRFAYTPEDCESFHAAIEEVVVPVASRIYAERKAKLGVDRLRPWDLAVEPSGKPPLNPFDDVSVLIERVGAMFRRLDPGLADYYDVMQHEGLLDLVNRPNKAPSAWCTSLAAARKPYIFMNAVGLHEDVMTLLHEAGHGFHWCEAYQQPYYQQRGLELLPIEFVEVASTAMEYLNAQFLPESNGGFYTEEDAARARIEHLQGAILFWPYMAIVDRFQHWAYTHPEDAADPAHCDRTWAELYRRYVPDVDWNGLEDALAIGWQRKVHIFDVPFYYVEYGLAQLGAVQIWRNSLEDQAKALAQYRYALSLGITVPLPELFAAAGAKFAFDPETLREAVDLMQATIQELEMA
jgi:oligoendopeptidase F